MRDETRLERQRDENFGGGGGSWLREDCKAGLFGADWKRNENVRLRMDWLTATAERGEGERESMRGR